MCTTVSEASDQEGLEVIRVSQWAEIRQMHLVDGVPKKEIARRFGLDVKTVRRALEQGSAPLVRKSPPRERRLDPCRGKMIELLRDEPKISAKRIGRLLGPGAAGIGERTIRKYVESLRRELFPAEAYVHRTQRPGETMEADFLDTLVRVGGVFHRAKVLNVTLPASNSYFAKAYPVERLECLLDGLGASFAYFGGLPRRVVLDNTSLAVKKVLPGTEREETRAFHAWRGAFPLAADFCAPAKGNEKGSVERGNEYVRGLFFRPIPEAATWDELNARLLVELEQDLDCRKLSDGRTARQALIAEREHLRPLPPRLPECCRIVSCVADKYGIVRVDRSQYSVPSELAQHPLLAKIFWDRIALVERDRQVATHSRSFTDGTYVLDARHILRLLEKKHRAIGESTAIQQMQLPPTLHELRMELRGKVRKPDREWVRVLRLLEEYSMDELERAVSTALERESPSLETIRMLLRQQSQTMPVLVPAQVANESLAAIEVLPAALDAYDELVGGAS